MPKITTPQSHKKLKWEYKIRFFTLLLLITSITLLLVMIFFMPSYTLLNSYENSHTQSNFSVEQIDAQQKNQNFQKNIVDLYELSTYVNTKKTIKVDVIKKIYQYADGLVDISAIELTENEEGLQITIRGNAKYRDSLLSFEDIIDKDSDFVGFKIPIDDLTKQEDITFNVLFTYHEK